MNYRTISIDAIFDDEGHPVHFFFQNGGGKYALFDAQPSKQTGVQDFLRAAFPEKPVESV